MTTEKYKEKFLNKLKNKYGEEYKLVGPYAGSKISTSFKHTCGYVFDCEPIKISTTGIKCPVCYHTKKTNINVVKYYFKLNYPDYDVISSCYKGSNYKLKIVHKKCGTIFNRTFDKVKQRGIHCPNVNCGGHHTWNINRVSETINNIYGNNYKVISFVSFTKPLTIKCIKHNKVYETKLGSLLRKDRDNTNTCNCPICSNYMRSINRTGLTKAKTSEEYVQECKEKGYDLSIEDYKNAKTKIKHKCNKGHIYEQTPGSHLHGEGCPTCNGNLKKTTKQYIQECKETGQDLPIEDYKNNKTRIKHRCSKGHIYKQTPDMHIGKYKQGCPVCSESHGEKYIRNYLDKNNIKYEPQKKFKDLKDKTYLSYDFYLPDYNILIEYQGIQHYESINIKGSGEYSNLKKQQHHDKLKREYAKNNGYKLLELKYVLDTQELVDKYLSRRIK